VARFVTGRIRSNCSEGVSSSTWTCWLGLHVSGCAGKVAPCDGCTGIQLCVHGVLLFGRVNLLEIRDTRFGSAGISRLHEVRDCDGHQDADNQDYDHDFDEGKCSVALVHFCLFSDLLSRLIS
jgi:hypothetical protein